MRVGSYAVDQAAKTVTFKLDDVFASPGEPLFLPGTYTLANGVVTYKIQDLPPELGVTF